jgi:hypothetical protein
MLVMLPFRAELYFQQAAQSFQRRQWLLGRKKPSRALPGLAFFPSSGEWGWFSNQAARRFYSGDPVTKSLIRGCVRPQNSDKNISDNPPCADNNLTELSSYCFRLDLP